MKIYLIRHGETDWNHVNRFQGREDIELNEAGIAQAVRCGQTLQGLGIEAVYTSPLKRAHCTGEEIAAQIGLSRDGVEPMQELIERDLGPFSGQLVKDKKEYFALAAGDHVEGMVPMCRNAWSMRWSFLRQRGIRQWLRYPMERQSMCFWQGLRIMRSEPERQDSTMGQSM